MLEMTGSCSKQRAHVRNDGVMFEMAGLCLKGWGGGSEWRAHVRKDRLVFEMVGLCWK
jgi:hypothetical protein